METTTVETAEYGRSLLGARIRFLMDGPHGNMIHSTVPPVVGRACHFRTIDEYWYVLSGDGEIWRRAPDGHESITRLIPGVSSTSHSARRPAPLHRRLCAGLDRERRNPNPRFPA